MNVWALILILGIIAGGAGAAVWWLLKSNNVTSNGPKKTAYELINEKAVENVEHIFNDEFREELRNRGRLHFEKIIGENAMFLQQDLRLTTSQLNEFLKDEITKKLQEEFSKYERSITDAKQLAIESITKTQEAIENQRQMMSQQLMQEVSTEKTRLIKRFEDNMADIVNHYILAAIGDQIDLNDQLEYILSEMEANKETITRDISEGA